MSHKCPENFREHLAKLPWNLMCKYRQRAGFGPWVIVFWHEQAHSCSFVYQCHMYFEKFFSHKIDLSTEKLSQMLLFPIRDERNRPSIGCTSTLVMSQGKTYRSISGKEQEIPQCWGGISTEQRRLWSFLSVLRKFHDRMVYLEWWMTSQVLLSTFSK